MGGEVTVLHGDCIDVLRGMEAGSIDAVVTDPPYDLTANKKGGTGIASVNLDSPYGRARIGTGEGSGGFMGKAWDSTGIAFTPELWQECLRLLKPGGHLLAFGGTRTYHRMVCAIEDAGFEIRDSLHWIYGSGFPKSLDVSKTIDKAAGVEREVLGTEDRRSVYDQHAWIIKTCRVFGTQRATAYFVAAEFAKWLDSQPAMQGPAKAPATASRVFE